MLWVWERWVGGWDGQFSSSVVRGVRKVDGQRRRWVWWVGGWVGRWVGGWETDRSLLLLLGGCGGWMDRGGGCGGWVGG